MLMSMKQRKNKNDLKKKKSELQHIRISFLFRICPFRRRKFSNSGRHSYLSILLVVKREEPLYFTFKA